MGSTNSSPTIGRRPGWGNLRLRIDWKSGRRAQGTTSHHPYSSQSQSPSLHHSRWRPPCRGIRIHATHWPPEWHQTTRPCKTCIDGLGLTLTSVQISLCGGRSNTWRGADNLMTGSLLRSLPHPHGHMESGCVLCMSGTSTGLSVVPGWPGWPPVFLPDEQRRLLGFGLA
jgi:hypothetical protein